MALERGPHPLFIAKAAAAGDPVDALLGFFQQAPGGFQPEYFDCFGRRATGLCLVASREVRELMPTRSASRSTFNRSSPRLLEIQTCRFSKAVEVKVWDCRSSLNCD